MAQTEKEQLASLRAIYQQTKLLLENTTKELISAKTQAETEIQRLNDIIQEERSANALLRMQLEDEASQRLLGVELIRKLQKESKESQAISSELQAALERNKQLEAQLLSEREAFSQERAALLARIEAAEQAQRQTVAAWQAERDSWEHQKRATEAIVDMLRNTINQVEADNRRLQEAIATARSGLSITLAEYEQHVRRMQSELKDQSPKANVSQQLDTASNEIQSLNQIPDSVIEQLIAEQRQANKNLMWLIESSQQTTDLLLETVDNLQQQLSAMQEATSAESSYSITVVDLVPEQKDLLGTRE